jgi:hypothetical protein
MNNKENNFESKIKSDINSHINCCKNILSGNVVNIASAAVKIIQSLKVAKKLRYWEK